MKRKTAQKVKGYSYLKLFILVVVILTIGLLAFRAVEYYRQRSFLTTSYITLYSNGEENFLVSYHSPNSYTVAQLYNTPNLMPSRSSLIQLSLALGVPIDAVVVDQGLKSPRQIFSPITSLKMLFFPDSFTLRNINAFDSFKYFFLEQNVDKERKIDTSIDYSSVTQEELYSLFRDEEIFNSAVSIEVMNGTEIGGLGGKFASMLASRGYNVVAVTNTPDSQNASFIVVRDKHESEAAKSLSHMLKYGESPIVGEIADIVIILGRDVAK